MIPDSWILVGWFLIVVPVWVIALFLAHLIDLKEKENEDNSQDRNAGG